VTRLTCLYIHIPFCLKKCSYCSFTSEVGSAALQKKYLKALRLELENRAAENQGPLSSLFIGGGTPTCLAPLELTSLIDHCKSFFGFEPNCEISIEANPGTVDDVYFESLLDSGVNRLSLGIQSFSDVELQAIGRLHTGVDAIRACGAAQKAGFTNINLDLMYGLPGQTVESWEVSLHQAFNLKIRHLSLYQLMVEDGTPFADLDKKGELHLPQEEDILAIDSLTSKICEDNNFTQYETSNYCLSGYECRHNINYWENNDYLAAGAAAVSYTKGRRERRVGDPHTYIALVEAAKSPVKEWEQLDSEASFRETVIMGLRMKRGARLEALQSRYGLNPRQYYGAVLKRLLTNNLVELTSTHLRITQKGWPLSNQIMAELV